ncbi:Protein of unknown function [Nitrosospira sp. Nsp14]|uniref:YdaU family protein n=1 Tax=Nitrosospira sp. Nsp14 TaxID=1855333 RepID=UPI0008F1D974|nr:YdaU family protein [Nitrosospira sp. Nsp14]SFH60358.1 Protein of unknown function [Nitrosospira sp. Nsp14]
MNYYERYCGDYQRDTAHLSLAEHGAYTMLLDTYFSVEKPLPSDLPSLYRVCRAMTRLEQQAVKSVVDQFFPLSPADGFRHNQRADREIAKARPKIEAARNNGRKGGRPRLVAPLGQGAETLGKPEGLAMGLSNVAADVTRGTTDSHDEERARNTIGDTIGDARGVARREPGGIAHQPQPQPQLHQAFDKDDKRTFHDAIDKATVRAEVQGGAATALGHDSSPHDHVFNRSLRPETPGSSLSASTTAGACCRALIQLGVQGCNPHHPTFQTLLNAGAAHDEFVQAARNAVARGKASFAYVIGTVKRQREDAAKLVLHRGRMPNSQELLESSNRAAADGWVPPELRDAGERATATGIDAAVGEGQHGN